MSCWALIALKASDRCKQRLAQVLTPMERTLLVSRMLDDLVTSLRQAHEVGPIAVVSPQPPPADGVVWLRDGGDDDLNGAVQQAAAELQRRGARELLVLPADLPLVRPQEIDALVRAGREHGAAFAPDLLRRGTNAVYLSLPSALRFRFGPDSLGLHLAEARAQALTPAVVSQPGIGFDIDTPADLARLLAREGSRYGFIERFARSTAWQPDHKSPRARLLSPNG